MTQAAQVSNLGGLCCFVGFLQDFIQSLWNDSGHQATIRSHCSENSDHFSPIECENQRAKGRDVCAVLPGCWFGCFAEVWALPHLRYQPNNLRPDAKSSPLGPMFQSRLCQTDTQNRCITMAPTAGLKGGLESGLCFKSPITMGLRLGLSPQPMDIH